MKLGLTGGIASGKSTVSAMFVSEGALLIDADQIAREIVLPGSPALTLIAERFGEDMLLQDGSLNRKRLGEVVFRDEQERKALEQITHPAIRKRMLALMDQYAVEQPDKLVIADIPLLYESGMEGMFDAVIVVYVPRAVQLKRLMERDGLTVEQAEQRLHAQMDIEDKRTKADYVIQNETDVEITRQQVQQLIRRLKNEKVKL
ncbi:dephospho-CoA kinase [Paenibacillus marinisediminis]